ncbi:MAG: sensor histidine kinase [Myxococcota bacterium]
MVLHAGAAVVGCLSLVLVGVAWWSFQRSQQQLTRVAQLSDSSTFLIADQGRQLAREQAALAQAGEGPVALVAVHLARYERAAARREGGSRSLNDLLTELELERWRLLEADTAALSAMLAEVAAALRGDDRETARERLRGTVPLMLEVQAQIDGFADFHQAENARRLLKTRGRVRESLRLSMALVGGMLGLIFLAWAYMWRVSKARMEATYAFERVATSNVDLDAYARRIAHDLRNLLGPPLLIASALERGSLEPGRVKETAGRLRRTLGAAAAMVDGLLELSRDDKESHLPRPSDARAVIEAVVDDIQPRRDAEGVTLVTELHDGMVSLSPGLLRMVVENLVDNAVKFAGCREGGKVHLASQQTEDGFLFTVSDTGPGIPAQALPHVFEPGYRGTDAVPGKGLGLATVKRIVDHAGGELDIRSTPGEGTEVRVWLPLAAPAARPSPAPAGPAPTQRQ